MSINCFKHETYLATAESVALARPGKKIENPTEFLYLFRRSPPARAGSKRERTKLNGPPSSVCVLHERGDRVYTRPDAPGIADKIKRKTIGRFVVPLSISYVIQIITTKNYGPDFGQKHVSYTRSFFS